MELCPIFGHILGIFRLRRRLQDFGLDICPVQLQKDDEDSAGVPRAHDRPEGSRLCHAIREQLGRKSLCRLQADKLLQSLYGTRLVAEVSSSEFGSSSSTSAV